MAFKISESDANTGEMGEKVLVAGNRSSMRLWEESEVKEKSFVNADYETLGFVVSGEAILNIAGQKVVLSTGDSWKVPQGAEHSYSIKSKQFKAVEVCSPGNNR